MDSKYFPPKPIQNLAKYLSYLLYLYIGLTCLAFIANLFEIKLFFDIKAGTEVSVSVATASDNIVMAISYIKIVLFIICAIMFLIWEYRACFNNWSFGYAGLTYTPGWSVGWWFIPFASLILPYRAMGEIWYASLKIENWKGKPAPEFITAIWVYLIIGGVLTKVATKYYASSDAMDDLIKSDIMFAICYVMAIFSAYNVIKFVSRVTAAQLPEFLPAKLQAELTPAASIEQVQN